MEDHRRLMEHWRETTPVRLLEVRYEDLVTEPDAGVRALLDFVGLPFEEACLHPHANRRHVNTASYAQVQEPIHAGAVGKWRTYAEALAPLAEALGQ